MRVSLLGPRHDTVSLQHQGNSIDWWCPDAFDVARRCGVPVLASVGYAACHGCHEVAA